MIDDLKDDYEDEYYYRDDKWSDFARTMNVVQYTVGIWHNRVILRKFSETVSLLGLDYWDI